MAVRAIDHGMVGTSTWNSWNSMKKRCYDPEDKSYAEYGGSGITVCERWRKHFRPFFEDMGERPAGMTLNRVKGAMVYSKETCEWATPTVQSYDQKMKLHNSSGRTGVFWRKDRDRWIVRIWKNKRVCHGGSYIDFEDAVKAREKLEVELYGFSKT